MYAVGNAQCHLSLVGDEGEEEDLCQVHSAECSLTHIPIWGWGCRGASLSCTQWGLLNYTWPQWGIGEEGRIFSMYTVGGAQ